MKFTAHIFLTAVFGLGLSSVAAAESPVSIGNVSANTFEAFTHDQLDAAFENFTSQGTLDLSGLAGPTSMDCAGSARAKESLETCVVRLIGIPLPAALAQN